MIKLILLSCLVATMTYPALAETASGDVSVSIVDPLTMSLPDAILFCARNEGTYKCNILESKWSLEENRLREQALKTNENTINYE